MTINQGTKHPTPLRRVREVMGYTQRAVADAVGLDQSTYSKIETGGTYKASAENAQRICGFFGPVLNELHVLFPERYPGFLSAGDEAFSSTPTGR